MPGEEPARWVRIHEPASSSRPGGAGTSGTRQGDVYRVNIEAGGRVLGGLWAQRFQLAESPSDDETRMLAAAADQIGQTLEQDRLRAESTSAELARRSDAMKSALLDSVSHDLRTPLASIRAAAGSLMDSHLSWTPGELQATARTIDEEAERLNRLVTNLLDMSRIEGGGLRAEIEPFELDDLVEATLQRIAPRVAGRRLEVLMPGDLPLVAVDPTFMDQILANVVENALKYAPPAALIRISAAPVDAGARVRLTIEDEGPGVPDEALPRLFEKFYRVPRSGEGARRGTGVGLAVVRGLAGTMQASVDARRSELGRPGGGHRPCRRPASASDGARRTAMTTRLLAQTPQLQTTPYGRRCVRAAVRRRPSPDRATRSCTRHRGPPSSSSRTTPTCARPSLATCLPTASMSSEPRRVGRRCPPGRPAVPTSCSWTLGCPTWTA